MNKLQIFWGGTDVSPSLYNEKRSQYTQQPDVPRDEREVALAQYCIENKIPMLGICRGAQLLNVINGGKLCQHIHNHGTPHYIEIPGGEKLFVNSTHHQMMLPAAHAEIIATCNDRTMGLDGDEMVMLDKVYEVVFYPDTLSLCVQFHPEWLPKNAPAVTWLKATIKKLLNVELDTFQEGRDHYYGMI